MISYYSKLIYLLPPALVTGPFLPDLIVILCSILFIIDTFRLKLFSYYNNNFFKIFFIFLISLNLSSFFSENLISLKYSISYLRFGVFSIFVFYILKNFNNAKILIGYSIIGTFIFLIFDGFIQFIFGKNIFFFELQNYNEKLYYVTSIFNEEKKLGGYLAKMFPLLLVSIIFIKDKYQDIKLDPYVSIIIFLTFFLILLTTERVALFIFLIFLFCIFIKSKIFLKPKIFFFGVITLFLIILFYYYPALFAKIKSILYSTGILFPGYTNQGLVEGGYDIDKFIFSKYHHDQILTSIELFLENPFFGIGAKNFKNIVFAWHPHNYHAQVLAELGIFSYAIIFSIFIFLIFKIFKKIFISFKLNEEINFYLLITFFVNIMPIPSADFFNNWINIIIFLPIGYYLYINEK